MSEENATIEDDKLDKKKKHDAESAADLEKVTGELHMALVCCVVVSQYLFCLRPPYDITATLHLSHSLYGCIYDI